MYSFSQPQFAAGGNIRPARFLAPVNSTGASVVEATDVAVPIFGIGWEETRFAPGSVGDDGYLAIAGEAVPYHGPGTICNLVLGGTVDAHAPLTTDNAGRGVEADITGADDNWVGAIALADGVSGDKIPVYVVSPFYIPDIGT